MPPRGFKPTDRFGIEQRARAAEQLAKWITTPDQHFDQDILVVGDWNAEPDKAEWKALRDLEDSGEIDFMDINPAEEITHIARLNKSGPAGTRLDLQLITNSQEAKNLGVAGEQGVVIQWSLFKHLDLLSATDRTALYKAMRTNFFRPSTLCIEVLLCRVGSPGANRRLSGCSHVRDGSTLPGVQRRSASDRF